ncbi:MAG: Rieske 2Fe-2S domain-containing protein [Bacteroidetes bacterium]|nr:Rieske 2Fe-2S domain-containing protein [Bacteroidota bacterium]
MIAREGKIIEIDGSKYAVSRNNYEWLDLVSAECTHLGCTIKWNRDENSWDCPCHGSRFTQTGIVINGPANSNLNHYKIKATEFDKYKTQIKETL